MPSLWQVDSSVTQKQRIDTLANISRVRGLFPLAMSTTDIPMSLTTIGRVEHEQPRPTAANAWRREKDAAARRRGPCRGDGKRDKKPGTKGNHRTCPDCREKATASASRDYQEGPLPPRLRPLAKLDGRRLVDATIHVPVTTDGRPPAIAFDPGYLADALEIGPTLRLVDKLNPGLATAASGRFCLRMSQRFTEETAKVETARKTPPPAIAA